MRTFCATRFGRVSVARTSARSVVVAAAEGSERITDSTTALAVVCRHRERTPRRRVLSAFQPRVALLDRAHPFDCRDLVFAAKFETPLAAQPAFRLCRRSCFFHRHI